MKCEYRYHDSLMSELNDFDFVNFDFVPVVNTLISNTKMLIKKFDTWVDVTDGVHHSDGIEDRGIIFPTKYNWKLIKFYENQEDFYLDNELHEIFKDLNCKLKNIKGIEYVHIHSITNFYIEPHTDGNLVLLINLITPENQSQKNYGLKILDTIYQPNSNELIWLETRDIHSAWNFSNTEWRFLAVSIDRQYVIMD